MTNEPALFIIEQGHRVNWVSGSLDSRVTGSLGHKMFHVCCALSIHARYCQHCETFRISPLMSERTIRLPDDGRCQNRSRVAAEQKF